MIGNPKEVVRQFQAAQLGQTAESVKRMRQVLKEYESGTRSSVYTTTELRSVERNLSVIQDTLDKASDMMNRLKERFPNFEY